ncbi:hypothetical protein ACNC1Z_004752, partial [Escherichia coli]
NNLEQKANRLADMKMEKLTLRKVRKTDVVLIRKNGPETGQKNPYIVGATGGEPGWLALKYRTSYCSLLTL